ncbi:MAG TPA: DinB family protein [Longimicrobiales bacterium]|nr:DinB family protein [Longimicrobiales bacterium]
MAYSRNTRPNRRRPQDDLRTLIRQVRDLAGGLDRETFNRRPGEDRWSVGECVDHLSASARLYLPVLTEAIHGARAQGLTARRVPGRTWLGRIVVWAMEPPPRRPTRMGTWPALEPGHDLVPSDTLDEFEALYEELIVRMNEAADLDQRRVKVRSALDSRLKLSLGDWFAFLAAHGRRHLWQADQALKELKERGERGEREEA